MISFVIPDGSNSRTAILPEGRVARFYIDESGEKVPQDASLSMAETVLLLLKLSLVNPRTSRSFDRAGGVVGA